MAGANRKKWRRDTSYRLTPTSPDSIQSEVGVRRKNIDYFIHYKTRRAQLSGMDRYHAEENARKSFVASMKDLGLVVYSSQYDDSTVPGEKSAFSEEEEEEEGEFKDEYIFIHAPLRLLVVGAELVGVRKGAGIMKELCSQGRACEPGEMESQAPDDVPCQVELRLTEDGMPYLQTVSPGYGEDGTDDRLKRDARRISLTLKEGGVIKPSDAKRLSELHKTAEIRTCADDGEKEGGMVARDGTIVPDDDVTIERVMAELKERTDEDYAFTEGERNLIVHEILETIPFIYHKSEEKVETGITRMKGHRLVHAVYPLHQILDEDGYTRNTRTTLWLEWGRPAACYKPQPLTEIREYFGEKIAMYFAWVGFYTTMLVPATLVGLIVLFYGLGTTNSDPVTVDICKNLDDLVMCPQCHGRCKYWNISETCIYATITHVFDNYATVAFALFMVFWGIFFLELWKRQQSALQTAWGVQDFTELENFRPRYESKRVTMTRESPGPYMSRDQSPEHLFSSPDSVRPADRRRDPEIMHEEPLTEFQKCCKCCSTYTVVFVLVVVVVAAIFGVIIYRITFIALLYGLGIERLSSWAKVITSFTASIINLICILILGKLYRKVAFYLTEFEMHKTETEFENAFTLKMFLFQFANTYGAIVYLAFFKGRFHAAPGSKSHYLFGRYQHPPCDPSGCMVNLLIQLFVVMFGKQLKGQIMEIATPLVGLGKCCKRTSDSKPQREWEKDKDLLPCDQLVLFGEYLELVIQYGFVTIFIAAFPLAPLFALLNNIVEIRVDAYKFLKLHQRPPGRRTQDIGIWFGILQSVTMLAIVSNAVIIAWTSDFVPKMVYVFGYSPDQTLWGYVNDSLALYDTSHFSNDTRPADYHSSNVTTCRYKGYRHPPGSDSPYTYTEQYWKVLVARLAFVIMFEHACLVIFYVMSFIIPDIPPSVREKQAKQKKTQLQNNAIHRMVQRICQARAYECHLI